MKLNTDNIKNVLYNGLPTKPSYDGLVFQMECSTENRHQIFWQLRNTLKNQLKYELFDIKREYETKS